MCFHLLSQYWSKETLTPAYGRDYKTKSALLADFEANRDFILHDGLRVTLINKEQIEPGSRIQFR